MITFLAISGLIWWLLVLTAFAIAGIRALRVTIHARKEAQQ